MQHIILFFSYITTQVYNLCFNTTTKAVITGSGVFTALTEINDFQLAHFIASSIVFVAKGVCGSLVGLSCKKLFDAFTNSKKGGANE